MDLFVIKDFLQLLRSNLRILDFVVNIMYQFMQRKFANILSSYDF